MAKKKHARKKWMAQAFPEETRGDFTAKAKRAGMTVAEYARYVLRPGSRASTKTKRQAVAAQTGARISRRNARKRKKGK